MNISQKDAILIKNIYLSRDIVHEDCLVNFPTRVQNLEASAEKNPHDRYNCHSIKQ